MPNSNSNRVYNSGVYAQQQFENMYSKPMASRTPAENSHRAPLPQRINPNRNSSHIFGTNQQNDSIQKGKRSYSTNNST